MGPVTRVFLVAIIARGRQIPIHCPAAQMAALPGVTALFKMFFCQWGLGAASPVLAILNAA
jgi:hypothetical protein